ncbi:MAG TPA: hypothetical protein VF132_12440 [Rudaea sp.]
MSERCSNEAGDAESALDVSFEFPAKPVAEPPTLERIVDVLPRLGHVLWLTRTRADGAFPRARLLAPGVLLLDHAALNALRDCVAVRAFGAVAAHGPREWLEFRDTAQAPIARLYLLPDTDLFAWDRMLAGCRVEACAIAPRGCPHACLSIAQRALRRRRETWEARIVQMPLLRLTGLRVLGLRASANVAPISREIAQSIACDDGAAFADGEDDRPRRPQ